MAMAVETVASGSPNPGGNPRPPPGRSSGSRAIYSPGLPTPPRRGSGLSWGFAPAHGRRDGSRFSRDSLSPEDGYYTAEKEGTVDLVLWGRCKVVS